VCERERERGENLWEKDGDRTRKERKEKMKEMEIDKPK
jgi:hypothetical protein